MSQSYQPLSGSAPSSQHVVSVSASASVDHKSQPPGGPSVDHFDEKIVRAYPRATATAAFVDSNSLENFALPGMIAMASYLYSELVACQSEQADPEKYNIPYALIVFSMLAYTLQNIVRASIRGYRSAFNLDSALVEAGLVSEDKMQAMNSSRIAKAAFAAEALTSASLITAGGLFAGEQFNSGVGALWFSLASYTASSLARMMQGRSDHLTITGKEYQGALSRMQQFCFAGIPIAAGGGIWFAIVNHEIQEELKKNDPANQDPHTVQALAAQATMVAGFMVLATLPRLRNAEAIHAAIEQVAEQRGMGGIHMNRSTMWGSHRRRDVANLELGFLNTAFSAGTVAALAQNQEALLTLLPALGAAMGLSWMSNQSANRAIADMDAVTNRVRDEKSRDATSAIVAAELEDKKGHCITICGRKFG